MPANGTTGSNLLETLKAELDLIEKGGYRPSAHTPWQPTSPFQDSPTCINYGYPYRHQPCAECQLYKFVPPERRNEFIPCHHIPLNEAGDTVETLELKAEQKVLEENIKCWLRMKIKELEQSSAGQRSHA